jgi:hypothetical protein
VGSVWDIKIQFCNSLRIGSGSVSMSLNDQVLT